MKIAFEANNVRALFNWISDYARARARRREVERKRERQIEQRGDLTLAGNETWERLSCALFCFCSDTVQRAEIMWSVIKSSADVAVDVAVDALIMMSHTRLLLLLSLLCCYVAC